MIMDGKANSGRPWRKRAAMFGRCDLSLIVAILAALAVWLTFFPGNMSYDSFMQYRNAWTFAYTNWHPPIMSIVLSIVILYGGGVGTLMLLQCLAGVLGIRALASMVMEQLSRGRWTLERKRWIATGVALFMLLPLTPTAFYLMTFWKDSWTAIFFVWLGAYGLWLFPRCKQLSRRAFFANVAGFFVLTIMTGITRHNTLVALPAAGGVLWLILARRGMRFSWLMIGLPVAGSLLTSAAIERIYSVVRFQPESHVKILELVGICVAYPECRAEFPYIGKNLREGGESSYGYGNVFSLIDPDKPVIDARLLDDPDNELLQIEYRHAIMAHPFELVYVKGRAFCRLLDPAHLAGNFFQKDVDPHCYGLKQIQRFARIRSWLSFILETSAHLPWVNWILYHNVWFSLNCFAIVGLLIEFFRRRSALVGFWIFVLAIPMGYSFSYFAATTGMDYRFLYPSTLFMQILALSFAAFYGTQYFAESSALVRGPATEQVQE